MAILQLPSTYPTAKDIPDSADDVGAIPFVSGADGQLLGLTSGVWTAVNAPQGFSGDYNDLTNQPTIPSTASDVGAISDSKPSDFWASNGLFDIDGFMHAATNGGYRGYIGWNGYRNDSGGFTYRGVNGNTTTAAGLEFNDTRFTYRAGTAVGKDLPVVFEVDQDGTGITYKGQDIYHEGHLPNQAELGIINSTHNFGDASSTGASGVYVENGRDRGFTTVSGSDLYGAVLTAKHSNTRQFQLWVDNDYIRGRRGHSSGSNTEEGGAGWYDSFTVFTDKYLPRFKDDESLYFGTGNDMRIRHDGTYSYIEALRGNLSLSASASGNSINAKAQLSDGTTQTAWLVDNNNNSGVYFQSYYNNNRSTRTIDGGQRFGYNDTYYIAVKHQGSTGHGFLTNIGGGDLYLRNQAHGGKIYLSVENADGSNDIPIRAVASSSSNNGYASLWCGDNERLRTTSAGVTIYGSATIDGNNVYHEGNKPTATDVGALPIIGGDVLGNVSVRDKLSVKSGLVEYGDGGAGRPDFTTIITNSGAGAGNINNWFKVMTVDMNTTGTYSTVAFDVVHTHGGSNVGYNLDAGVVHRYRVGMNVSGAVNLDQNNALVVGTSNTVRVVKKATGLYELQVNITSHKASRVEIKWSNYPGGVSSVQYHELVDYLEGEETGTIYTAIPDGYTEGFYGLKVNELDVNTRANFSGLVRERNGFNGLEVSTDGAVMQDSVGVWLGNQTAGKWVGIHGTVPSVYDNGYHDIYHEGNKPTAADVGAITEAQARGHYYYNSGGNPNITLTRQGPVTRARFWSTNPNITLDDSSFAPADTLYIDIQLSDDRANDVSTITSSTGLTIYLPNQLTGTTHTIKGRMNICMFKTSGWWMITSVSR